MSVAKPLPHDAARLHVTGTARYIDDIPVPAGCLSLAFGTSDVAHGRILSVDLDAVRAAPGVVAVLVAGDLPFANDVSPSIHDEPLLAVDEVFYIGQPWTEDTIGAAWLAWEQDFTPMSDMRASAEYRLEAARNMLTRYYLEDVGADTRVLEVQP